MSANSGDRRGGDPLAALLISYRDGGEDEAMVKLVAATRPRLCAIASRICGAGEAEDAVQSAYMSLLRREQIAPDLPVMAWLTTAVVRIAYRQRAQSRRQVELADRLAREPSRAAPERSIEEAEEIALLAAAVDRLPAHYRDPVILHYWHGLTVDECAALLGLPRGTVGVRLHRARALLDSRMSPSMRALVLMPFFFLCDLARAATALPASAAALGVLVSAKTTTIVVLIAALLLGGVWWWSRDASHPHPVDQAGAPMATDRASTQKASADAPTVDSGAKLDAPLEADADLAVATESASDVPIADEAKPGAILEGRIVDPAGQAIAKAVLVARRPRTSGYPKNNDGDFYRPAMRSESSPDREEYFPCDETGAFIARGLGAGIWEVFGMHDEHRSTLQMEFNLEATNREEGLVLTLRPATSLAGRVVDAEGKGLADAQLVAYAELGRPIAKASTDESGEFEVKGLAADTQVLLTVELDGYALSADGAKTLGYLSGKRDVVIVLLSEAIVRGLVKGPDGEALVDAYVRILPAGEAEFSLLTRGARSDAEGTFEIRGVIGGVMNLSCSKSGLISAIIPMLEVSAGTVIEGLVLELGAPVEITGTVRDDKGAPIVGISVRAQNPGRGASGGGAGVSDFEGRFTIQATSTDDLQLSILPMVGYETRRWNLQMVKARGGDHLDIVLSRAITLRGRVLNGEGDPVSGCTFAVRSWEAISMGRVSPAPNTEISNDAGVFVLSDIPGDALRLVASAGETAEAIVNLPQLESGDDIDLGDIKLASARAVVGVVLDEGGQPIADAQVRLYLLEAVGSGWHELDIRKNAVTGSDGGFRFAAVGAARARVDAQHSRYASARVDVDIAGADSNEVWAELRMGKGAAVEGLVLDPDGKPWPACQITIEVKGPRIEWLDDRHGSSRQPAVTDEQGRYLVEGLPAGEIGVRLSPPGAGMNRYAPNSVGISYFRLIEVVTGKTTRCDFGDERRCLVRGAVHGWPNAAGETIATTVSLLGDGSRTTAILAGDGSFEFKPVPPGEYRFTVWRSDGASIGQYYATDVSIPDIEEHELIITVPGQGISGIVTRDDGQAARGISLSAIAVDDSTRGGSAAPGADGTFSILHLDPGTYDVIASQRGYGRAIVQGVRVENGRFTEGLILEIKKGGTLEIEVVDRESKPVGVGFARIYDEQDRNVDVNPFTDNPRPGLLRYEGVPAGALRIVVGDFELGVHAIDGVIVESGRLARARVVIGDQGPSLRVLVTRAGAPVAEARVEVRDAGGRLLPSYPGFGVQDSVKTRDNGTARIGRVPAADLIVRATKSGASAEVAVPASSETGELQIVIELE